MAGQVILGKAFEYACLSAVKEKATGKPVYIDEEALAYKLTKDAFESLPVEQQVNYKKGARAALKIILPAEPKILNGEGVLHLALNDDKAGQAGDVRDLVIQRPAEHWEIGISCKHNHEALKHPRVTKEGNFGADWAVGDCSRRFLIEVQDITSVLDGSRLWTDIPDKQKSYYVPLLDLYAGEIQRMCEKDSGTPRRLLEYFFGVRDFYKVICLERQRQTKVAGFHMYSTLNKPAKKDRPAFRVKQIRFPEALIQIARRNDTTVVLTFDKGWAVKMRLHNKDKKATATSLAWDVQLEGMPSDIFFQTMPWDE